MFVVSILDVCNGPTLNSEEVASLSPNSTSSPNIFVIVLSNYQLLYDVRLSRKLCFICTQSPATPICTSVTVSVHSESLDRHKVVTSDDYRSTKLQATLGSSGQLQGKLLKLFL